MQTEKGLIELPNLFSFLSGKPIPRDINRVIFRYFGNGEKLLIQKSIPGRNKTWRDDVTVTPQTIEKELNYSRRGINDFTPEIKLKKMPITNFWALTRNNQMINPKKVLPSNAPMLLVYAALSGNIELIQKCTTKKLVCAKQRSTGIHIKASIIGRSLECIKFFLDNGFKIGSHTSCMAALDGNLECLISVYGKEFTSDRTLIGWAIKGNSMECATFVFSKLNQEEKIKAFLLACEKGRLEIAMRCLPEKRFNCIEGTRIASIYGHVEILRSLLDMGYIPETECLETSFSRDRLECFNLLLERGLKPSKKVIRTACQKGNLDVVKLCVSEKIEPDECDFESALGSGHEELCYYLISIKCPVQASATDYIMSKQLLKKLIDYGALLTKKAIKNIYGRDYIDLLYDLKMKNFYSEETCDYMFEYFLRHDISIFSNLLELDLIWNRREEFCGAFSKKSKIEKQKTF